MVRKSSELDISRNNSRDCGRIAGKNRGNFKVRKTGFGKSDDDGTQFD